jgi:peptidoglycan hydrolase-like protein with peptidoglycan-binding domain
MWGYTKSLPKRIISIGMGGQVGKVWKVSGRCLVFLTVMSVAGGLSLSGTAAGAQDEAPKRLSDDVKKYWDNSKALAKTDTFNIRVALKRAVRAEQPGTPFRWNNIHTKHHGEITLLDFIQPRRNNRMCADFKHTYFLGGALPIEDEGMVCRDSKGRWDDIVIRATSGNTRSAEQSLAGLRQSRKIVREAQGLLYRLNYDPGPVDGRNGPKTRRAIEQFQRNEGLPVTGRVSTELTSALEQKVAMAKDMPSASMDDVSDSKPAYALSSGDTTQPVLKAFPGKEGTGDTSDMEGASEFVSQHSLGANEAVAQRYAEDERPENLTLDEGSATPSGMNTPAIAESGEPSPIEGAQVDKKPVLLTINSVSIDPTGQAESLSTKTNTRVQTHPRGALRQEWTFTDDWLNLPWSISVADIATNVMRAKKAINRAYRTANADGRQIVIATHGWGGVLVYRAILELYKEKGLPAGAIDILATMGAPLSAQADSTRYSARKYAYWQGSLSLAEPVKVWLNYWIKEDQSSGSIAGVTKNIRLLYTPSTNSPPRDAYHETAVFQNRIERDILVSLQNPNSSNVAQDAERSITDDALSAEESTNNEITHPQAVQAGAEQDNLKTKIDKQQIEFSRDHVNFGSTNIATVSKNTSTPTKLFVFPWFSAILGLAFCVVAGAFFSWFLVPRVNESSDRRTRGDQAMGADECTTSGQFRGDSDQTAVLIRNHAQVGSQQNEGDQTKLATRELAGSATEPQSSTQLAAEDIGDMILQVITEFDDIIQETERVLSLPNIDRDTRNQIVEAVEVAKSLIEKTCNSNHVAGRDHGQTAEAIEEATKLIKDALETNLNSDTSRLPFQHRI